MQKIQDDIFSYREMCDLEGVQTLQRGMNYKLNYTYSVILMSQRTNAPYKDKVHSDGLTIEYEGHDVSRKEYTHNPKGEDQPEQLPSGTLTQNGKFKKAVDDFKAGKRKPELVKVYEKIMPGIWSLKGMFQLDDYKYINDGKRNVFRFILQLTIDSQHAERAKVSDINVEYSRVIPSEVKKEVWKRDKGQCVLCGSDKDLHFDHDLPYSKGGTSLSVKNVRLLCMKHNLEKSGKIE
jgi:hypothetical protein